MLNIIVPVGQHGDENVHENDEREADVERVDGEHQPHARLDVLRVLGHAFYEVTDAQRRHENLVDGRTGEDVLMSSDQHPQRMQRARERHHREDEHQTEVQDHVLDDDLLEHHEEDVELLGDSAEQNEVRHPAEQEDHRRRLQIRLPRRSTRVAVVPCRRINNNRTGQLSLLPSSGREMSSSLRATG